MPFPSVVRRLPLQTSPARLHRRLLRVLPAAALAGSVWFAVGAARADATLRIGNIGNHPPWSSLEDGKPGGFEIELVRDLCRRLDVTCSVLSWRW
ncbi:MAG TPA: hypothetical protein VGC80_07575, partial [Acetobacteraceae bacterium]